MESGLSFLRAIGLESPLRHVVVSSLDVEALRRRAPGVVERPDTYDRRTIAPTPGGLFDEAIFGPGASLQPYRWTDAEIVLRERAIRFGRIVFSAPVPHPLVEQLLLPGLPVLPPDLRAIELCGSEFLMSDLNALYQQVLIRNGRLRRLREVAAPSQLLDSEQAALTEAVAALFDNERLRVPRCDDSGRPLVSLGGLFRPDAATALSLLDESVAEGIDPTGALPMRLHRTVATVFAMGFEVQAMTRH